MRRRARWELCYNAMILEMPLPPNASTEDVARALQEIINDVESTWLTTWKVRQILPSLRQTAQQFGCLELIEQLEAHLSP